MNKDDDHAHDLRISKRGTKERPIIEPKFLKTKKTLGRISEHLPKFGKLVSKEEKRAH